MENNSSFPHFHIKRKKAKMKNQLTELRYNMNSNKKIKTSRKFWK